MPDLAEGDGEVRPSAGVGFGKTAQHFQRRALQLLVLDLNDYSVLEDHEVLVGRGEVRDEADIRRHLTAVALAPPLLSSLTRLVSKILVWASTTSWGTWR